MGRDYIRGGGGVQVCHDYIGVFFGQNAGGGYARSAGPVEAFRVRSPSPVHITHAYYTSQYVGAPLALAYACGLALAGIDPSLSVPCPWSSTYPSLTHREAMHKLTHMQGMYPTA